MILKSWALVFIILMIGNSLCAQKRKFHDRSGWVDTTGTAALEASRNHFLDSLPDPTGLTSDFENIFKKEEIVRLDSLIKDYEKKTTVEFCIVTMDTMQINKEHFGELPQLIEHSWGIGKKNLENGIVICLSVGYRAIRIYAGKGIQDYLDSKETSQIIQKNILPAFKKEHYFDGTMSGLIAIIETLDRKMRGKVSASR
ncbi:MAG: hypothetical protein NVS3B19_14830 [Ginsengibacter sp.]